MSYQLEVRRRAQRELDRIRGDDYQRLRQTIRSLAEDPWPRNTLKLAGLDLWRLRVGDYRIIYAIDEARERIVILRVARREERTYRGL